MADKTDKPVKTEKKQKKLMIHWWEVIKLTVIIFFMVLISIIGYGYYRLSSVSSVVAAQVANIESIMADDKKSHALLHQMEEVTQEAQRLTAKQEKLLKEWQAAQQGDMSAWQMAEAKHLLELANQQVLYQHDLHMALVLLQKANQVLQTANSHQANNIKQAISRDIQQLQQISSVNQQKLYLQLYAVDLALNHLPWNKSLQPDQAEVVEAKPGANDSWWQAGLQHSWQVLKQIVVVRQLQANTVPLVMPEEKVFLLANLHSKLDHAMWAVLHNDPVIYQHSLSMVITWVTQYFDQTAPATKVVLNQLQILRQLNVAGPRINFNNTLQLFGETQAATSIA